MLISQVKENIIGMSHGGTLNKVRNFEAALERAGNNVLSKIKPTETIRTTPLAQIIHDDLNNYPLPSDYDDIIDLFPEDNRTSLDDAQRDYAANFARRVGIDNKRISIEGSEGMKFMRVNWKSRQAKVFNSMNSLTSGGTWAVVGTASGLKLNTLYKVSGTASIEFDVNASGDGIQVTNNTNVDLTNEDELADVIFPVFFGSVANLTSVTPIWGNDLTTNYWTGVAQTAQADGTAFRAGWNYIKASWSAATETGTVAPATTDSFKLTVQSTGAIANVRVDNIIFSLGRSFDLKYYSKYLIKNTAGTWISRTGSDDDIVVLDNDSINIYLFEGLKACAQQVEGEDSQFDINYANRELNGNPDSPDPLERLGLYGRYRNKYPSQTKKAVTSWSSGPRFRR